ncbi:addiction module antitoxin, RelB/DinJ family [Streptococcus pneumoniae]|nr:type II toxin-antitoxin system RelB/DinJ family antitoxin [Streptococcus pneumoniae]CAG5613113.1 addiction module antitoxin, RelB/DinJ family [Streptococcus pneumoniae]
MFSNLGMDMTTAINIFLRQAIQYQGLPFDVRLDENRKLLQVLTDLDQNRNMSQSFESVSDLMEDLRA